MTEVYRTLVLLPYKLDEAKLLAYCAVLQAFVVSVKHKIEAWNTTYKGQEKKEVAVELTIVCPDDWYRMVLTKILRPKELMYVAPPRKGFNYVIDLKQSQVDAFKYSKVSHKHFAHLLGILVGAETGVLPDVRHLHYEASDEYACDILLTPKMSLWVGNKLKDLKTRVIGKNMQFDQLCVELHSAKLLLGEVSLETYLASAFNMHVMEVTEKSIGRSFLSKFVNPNYRQYIVADEAKCDDAFMTRFLGQWETISKSKVTHKSLLTLV